MTEETLGTSDVDDFPLARSQPQSRPSSIDDGPDAAPPEGPMRLGEMGVAFGDGEVAIMREGQKDSFRGKGVREVCVRAL
jgi:hypothetical protein